MKKIRFVQNISRFDPFSKKNVCRTTLLRNISQFHKTTETTEIRTRPSFYDYLKKYKGVFQNFDFFPNGGHFKSKMAAIMDLNGRHWYEVATL